MKFNVIKIENNHFIALDDLGENIVASTNIEHKIHNVPLMKPEWFKELVTSIELETQSNPIFKPVLVDNVGLAYNITETYESVKKDQNGFAILIKTYL